MQDSGDQESEVKLLAVPHAPLEAARCEFFLASSSFGRRLEILVFLGLWQHIFDLCFHVHMACFPVSALWVSTSFILHKDTSHWIEGLP